MYQAGREPPGDNADDSSPSSIPQLKEDDKMPLFLIKLWNIVADPTLEQIIRWDDSGYSFHIIDPYSFCRNVLPHYFKHNNLNSLIRQLNMYGFRKMTPIDRGGLTRAESDQDHLEFSHPYFVRDRPELLVQIKRKSSARAQSNTDTSDKVNQNLNVVMDELHSLREKQKSMNAKMDQLVKENGTLWEHISHQRAQHHKQQQVVNKLVQFIVALVQPNTTKNTRLGAKRNLLAIDEPPNKRYRTSSTGMASGSQLTEILDRLQREMIDSGIVKGFPNLGNCDNEGPIIADVTDELSQSPPQPPPMPHPNDYSAPMTTRSSYNSSVPNRNFEQQNIPRTPRVPQYQNNQPMATQMNVPQRNYQPSNNEFVYNHPKTTTLQQNTTQMQPNTFHNEFSEYLNGVDAGIDNCRDLIGGQWDLDFNEEAWEELNNQNKLNQPPPQQQPFLLPRQQKQRLALEDGVVTSPESNHQPRDMLISPGPHGLDIFPGTPDLLTPIQSPHH